MAGVNKKLVTPELRLSYTHLFEPRAVTDGGEEKYSVSILIPKKDKKTIKQINDIVTELIDKNQDILKTKKPNQLNHPLRDGDEEREGDAAYEDHMFMSANAKNKPIVVDADRQPILETREIYSGMYGRVSVNFFAYNKAGKKGIACALNAVQKTKDGESLGGSYTMDQIEKDFDDLGEEEHDDDLL